MFKYFAEIFHLNIYKKGIQFIQIQSYNMHVLPRVIDW